MSSRKALVTGAGGFVGANLVRRLLSDGHTVVATCRPGGTSWRLEEIERNVELLELDVCDGADVRRAIAATRPDWIFHLAAYGADSRETDRERILATNLLGTVGLLTAAVDAGFDAFVNAGSSSEYGLKDHAPTETELPEPNSDYAAAKVAATLYAAHVARSADAPVVTLRLYSAYGPWEDPGRLVPTLAARGLGGELPPLVTPTVARDFVYVDDVCDAFVLGAQRGSPGAVYNVGTGIQTTIGEIVEIARRELELRAEPRWGSMDERRWDTATWVANAGKIERDLGWRPRVPIAEGFRRTVTWLRDRPELWARYGVEPAGAPGEPSTAA